MKEYAYIDLHTAGEPFRLLTEKFDILGSTMEEKRQYAIKNMYGLSRLVLREPRGNDDMYGGLLTDPVNEGSDIGVLFMTATGWSTMCGHGIICLARACAELGIVKIADGWNDIVIDAPSATVTAMVHRKDGIIDDIKFENDESFVCAENIDVRVDGYGKVKMDVGYGAAFMVFREVSQFGLLLTESSFSRLLDAAVKCLKAAEVSLDICHPLHPERTLKKNGCCMILTDKPVIKGNEVHTNDFTVFGLGQYDRSPTGTGSCALAALLNKKGILTEDKVLINRGISHLPFEITVKETENGVIPTVGAMAFITGRGTVILEDGDPLCEGFSAMYGNEKDV